jgi:hypothetical protein
VELPWLTRLQLLPDHHGDFCQIRCCSRRNPVGCPGWNDNIPFLCRSVTNFQGLVANPFVDVHTPSDCIADYPNLVAVSGIAIITKGVPFNRRNRFVLTAGLAIGYGATLVSDYFSSVFTYSGDNHALQGFLDAIVLIMETGFAVTAVICMILNLTLPEEIEETDESLVPAGSTITGHGNDKLSHSTNADDGHAGRQVQPTDEEKRL